MFFKTQIKSLSLAYPAWEAAKNGKEQCRESQQLSGEPLLLGEPHNCQGSHLMLGEPHKRVTQLSGEPLNCQPSSHRLDFSLGRKWKMNWGPMSIQPLSASPELSTTSEANCYSRSHFPSFSRVATTPKQVYLGTIPNRQQQNKCLNDLAKFHNQDKSTNPIRDWWSCEMVKDESAHNGRAHYDWSGRLKVSRI